MIVVEVNKYCGLQQKAQKKLDFCDFLKNN